VPQLAVGVELFGSEVGETAVKAKLPRAVAVTLADTVVELPPATFTLTVPPVTMAPDQELVVPEPLTMLLLESLNCQLANVAPEEALFTVQVVLLPRVTDDGEQLSVMTLTPPLPPKPCIGQVVFREAADSRPDVQELVEPTEWPVCVP
jgi:hypothetical protein